MHPGVEHDADGFLKATMPLLPRTPLFQVKTTKQAESPAHWLHDDLHVSAEDAWHCVWPGDGSQFEWPHLVSAVRESAASSNVMLVRDDLDRYVCITRRFIAADERLVKPVSVLGVLWPRMLADVQGVHELAASALAQEVTALHSERVPKFGFTEWPVEALRSVQKI